MTVNNPKSDAKTEHKEAQVKIPCEVYSRIVGYLRPVQNWHQGKQQEFSERKTFSVKRDA